MSFSNDECETASQTFLQCLVTHNNERLDCSPEEQILRKCNETLRSTKGVPANATYCVEEIIDYAKCSVKPNTSMCSAQYTQFHECKVRRRKFLFGDDLGLSSSLIHLSPITMTVSGLAAERARCDDLNFQYNQCLNKSGRNPSKCSSIEGDLRKCSLALGKSYCIDETIALMNCAKSPVDTSLCADQFIAMRECNRPRGPQIAKADKGQYRVLDSPMKNEFYDNASHLLAQSVPPTETSTEKLRKAAGELASSVGIPNVDDIRF